MLVPSCLQSFANADFNETGSRNGYVFVFVFTFAISLAHPGVEAQ